MSTHLELSELSRDELEAEVVDLRRRLQRAQALLGRGALHEIAARLSSGGVHLFRNLVTGLQGHARLLLEEKPMGDPDRDSLLRIHRSAGKVIELLGRFRSLEGKSAASEVLQVDEEIAEFDPTLRTLLGEWVALDIDIREPARVEIPKQALQRLFLAQGLFAFHRMRDGGMVHMTLEKDRTVTDQGEVHRWAVLTLADTGEPLDDIQVEHAFDPLAGDPPSRGTLGMSLSLADYTARKYGGRLEVVSQPEGLKTRIMIPLAGSSAGRVVESDAPQVTRTVDHVLVVDDDDAVREVAVKILIRSGFRIDSADSAESALALLETMDAPPDMLLTDIVMPGLNGRELAEKVQEIHPGTPVLFMSAYTEDEVILRGVRVAEVNFLPKPFTLEGLVDAVRSTLAERDSGSSDEGVDPQVSV